jgi:hypothetical protein
MNIYPTYNPKPSGSILPIATASPLVEALLTVLEGILAL